MWTLNSLPTSIFSPHDTSTTLPAHDHETVGADTGTSANPADYDVPNAFRGVMKGLTINI